MEREQLQRQYSELSRQLSAARRAGADLAPLKAELKRVGALLGELSPCKRKRRQPEEPPCLKTRVIGDPSEIAGLRDAWNDLLERADNYSPFLTWEWWWPWFECIGQDHYAPHMVVVADEAGRLYGGLPLACKRRGGGAELVFMGSDKGPDPAYLTAAAEAERRPEILSQLMRGLSSDPAITALRWDQCPVDDGLGQILGAAAREDWMAAIQVKRQYIHGALPGTWEEFIAQVPSRNRRDELRHQFRDVERKWGPVALGVHREADAQALALIDQMASFTIRRRATLRSQSRWNDDRFRRCLLQTVELFAQRGWFRLFTVSVAGELAAAMMGWAYHGTFFAYQIGEVNHHAELGLGHCVINHALHTCVDEGLDRFEFLGKAQRWKLRYFGEMTPSATITMGPGTSRYWSTVGLACLRQSLGRWLNRGGG
jgi:CelD/BcsL family acetyltransferase involved in cellulose biosynthesis